MTDRGHTYTEEWRAQTEAAFWLSKVRERGPRNVAEGQAMLAEILAPIAKRRGQAAADELRRLIEIERKRNTQRLDETKHDA